VSRVSLDRARERHRADVWFCAATSHPDVRRRVGSVASLSGARARTNHYGAGALSWRYGTRVSRFRGAIPALTE
jgi:hypothetical protein